MDSLRAAQKMNCGIISFENVQYIDRLQFNSRDQLITSVAARGIRKEMKDFVLTINLSEGIDTILAAVMKQFHVKLRHTDYRTNLFPTIQSRVIERTNLLILKENTNNSSIKSSYGNYSIKKRDFIRII